MFRIAIVGRPNVGKSTLFNKLSGRRKAIVGDEPGITRDRIYGTAEHRGKAFEVMDTGGLMPLVRAVIPAKILEQVEKAIQESDLVLLVVDGRAGATPADEQLLPMLRRSGRPIWVIVNKIDTPELEPAATPFYAFGAEEVLAVSAEHSRGIGDLLDAIAQRAGNRAAPAEAQPPEEIAVAVVGRPNVGKSSLVNRLLGMERTIVSEMPGTTRDAVDTRLVRDGTTYRIIDTAGIRRKGKTEERADKISVIMARKNLDRADVALLLVDAEEGVTKLDATIGGYAADSGCSVLIVLNKWDKVRKDQHTQEEYSAALRRRMNYLSYAPVITLSALTGQRVPRLFQMIRRAYEARQVRIPTAALNHVFVPDLVGSWTRHHPAQKLPFRYITQVHTSPPTFVVFTTRRKPLHFSIERLLINQLREKFGFYAAPIRIQQRLKQPASARRHGRDIDSQMTRH